MAATALPTVGVRVMLKGVLPPSMTVRKWVRLELRGLYNNILQKLLPSAVLDPTLMMNGTLLSPQSRKGPVMSKL
jgi:hypothetical protein